MTVIHAYRRKEPTTVELFGLSIQFKPNDKKDVVAEVDHDEAVHRLLSIGEAYRLYVDQLGAPAALATRVIDARIPLGQGMVTTGASAIQALSTHDEASLRLVEALSARINTLDSRVTSLGGVLTSQAATLTGEGWQLDPNGTAEFPGVTVGSAETKPADDAAASQGEAQDDGATQDHGRSDAGPEAAPYVFANEAGESIDISKWTAKEIRDFADANEIELPKGNSVKVGDLRDLLAAALAAGSKE